MPLGLTTTLKNYLAADSVFPLWFVHIDLPTTPSYSWTGVGTTVQNGQTWYGVGEHGIVSGLQSTKDISAFSVQLALVGIPSSALTPSILQKTRTQQYQGRTLEVLFTAGDLTTGLPLTPPELIWSGFADVMTMNYGKTVSIGLSAENLCGQLSRINGLTMTTASHNARLGNPSPADIFFDAQSRLAGILRPNLTTT